jgi:hypothetical protein
MYLINEHYINLLGNDHRKDFYAHEAHKMLTNAYATIGGLKGSGFSSPDDMKSIHQWKLKKRDGKIIAGVFYKNPGSRKLVAAATDGSPEGKEALSHTMAAEFKKRRSFMEVSGPLFSSLHKTLGHDELSKHLVHRDHVHKFLDDEIHPPNNSDIMVKKFPQYKDHFYSRKLGDDMHTKILLGHKVPYFSKV